MKRASVVRRMTPAMQDKQAKRYRELAAFLERENDGDMLETHAIEASSRAGLVRVTVRRVAQDPAGQIWVDVEGSDIVDGGRSTDGAFFVLLNENIDLFDELAAIGESLIAIASRARRSNLSLADAEEPRRHRGGWRVSPEEPECF